MKIFSIRDSLRQALNVLFAVTQIFTGYFLTTLNIGRSIQSQSDIAQTPVTPAGYAFSIWGFIFLFALLYAIYQAAPSRSDDKLLRRIGWFTAGAFFLNSLWIVVAQLITFNWPTAVIIVMILCVSLGALFRLAVYEKPLTKREKWLVLTPISVLAGWVSAATFANISSVLVQLNFGNFGLSLSIFSSIIIVLATLFASWAYLRSRGNTLYAIAILWALVAVLIGNIVREPDPIAAGVTGAMIVAVLSLMTLHKRHYGV